MKRSRGTGTSARTPASAKAPADKPAAASAATSTKLSAGGAFALNACFVAGLLVLSQLSVMQQRPVVRASIVAAALLLLAWSGLLFGVLRRRQKVTLEFVLRRQHYLQACLQGTLILYWGYYWREVYHAAPLIAAQLLFAYGFDACSRGRTAAPSRWASVRSPSFSVSRCSSGSRTTGSTCSSLWWRSASWPRNSFAGRATASTRTSSTPRRSRWPSRTTGCCAGMPGFYDKLLQVPLLNLSVKLLDRLARSPALQRISPSEWGLALVPRQRHLAYMGVWAAAFVAMSASGYVGDKHPGQFVPFWQKACAADTRSACEDLYFLEDGYCEDGSGWACNELGILLTEHYANRRRAAMVFERACGLGFSAGCDHASAMTQGDKFRRDAPTAADYRFILRGSKGPLRDRAPAQLYARACEQGWPGTCTIRRSGL